MVNPFLVFITDRNPNTKKTEIFVLDWLGSKLIGKIRICQILSQAPSKPQKRIGLDALIVTVIPL